MRYPIEAKVVVHKSRGERVTANASDISGAGMLLHMEQSPGFTLDEVVTVVRIVDNDVALRVCAGTFAA